MTKYGPYIYMVVFIVSLWQTFTNLLTVLFLIHHKVTWLQKMAAYKTAAIRQPLKQEGWNGVIEKINIWHFIVSNLKIEQLTPTRLDAHVNIINLIVYRVFNWTAIIIDFILLLSN